MSKILKEGGLTGPVGFLSGKTPWRLVLKMWDSENYRTRRGAAQRLRSSGIPHPETNAGQGTNLSEPQFCHLYNGLALLPSYFQRGSKISLLGEPGEVMPAGEVGTVTQPARPALSCPPCDAHRAAPPGQRGRGSSAAKPFRGSGCSGRKR